jgi:hypothetical protein
VRRAFPQAEIEVWSGMGHHPVRERFEELLALVIRAAAGAPPRPEAGAGADTVAA